MHIYLGAGQKKEICCKKKTGITLAKKSIVGKRDEVTCFSCGKCIWDWEDDDEPWITHIKHSPDCDYVLETKGKEFVKSIAALFNKPTGGQAKVQPFYVSNYWYVDHASL